MGPGGMRGGPPSDPMNDKLKEPLPKSIREVPGYIRRVTKSFFSRLFYIFKLVWETKPWILFVMLFMSVFNGVMPVIGAYIGAALLNSLASAYLGSTPFSAVMALLIIQFGYIFLKSIVTNINTVVSRIYGELVVNHIKLKIMNKAREIDMQSFDQPDFYSKLENANREAGQRPIQILDSTFSIMSTLISMISFIAILWAVSPFAPAIIIVISIPSAIINFVYRRKNAMYIRHRSKERRKMSYYSDLMTNKDMVKEIRMFSLSDTFIGRYSSVFNKYFAGLKKLYVTEGAWHIGLTVLSSAVNCGLFLFIAQKVCAGEMQVGDYSLYTGALNSIASGIASLISTTATIYEGTLFIDNMIAFMGEKRTIVPSLASPVMPERHVRHTIELKDVSFRYPGTERDVIKHVNLTLRAGETAVLVGLNGAGKTTLIKLITRLYDPTEGVILLDGRDIKEYDTSALYSIFGIIFQDFGKYAVNVRENIAFGDIDRPVEEDRIENAARESNSDVFIDKLPDRYDTPLMRYFEDNGIELSIGQWQKLSIARAFYGDSDIVILDEPTASLDAIAEQEIFNQFDRLRRSKMTIFVSHRLSSATVASKIIVLKDGEIVEEGTHHELMQKRGHYYTLFSTQAQRYMDNGETENAPVPGGSDEAEAENTESAGQSRDEKRGQTGQKPPEGFNGAGKPPFGEKPQFNGKPPAGEKPPFSEKPPSIDKPGEK